jgi:hypothetical protein
MNSRRFLRSKFERFVVVVDSVAISSARLQPRIRVADKPPRARPLYLWSMAVAFLSKSTALFQSLFLAASAPLAGQFVRFGILFARFGTLFFCCRADL